MVYALPDMEGVEMRKSTVIGRQLGEKIRRLRTRRGMTAADLGRAAGVSRSEVHRIENATRVPGVFIVEDIATALGTTVNRLLA
jgi:transcriptional regulator with XRE-family HTH domain